MVSNLPRYYGIQQQNTQPNNTKNIIKKKM